MATQSDLKTQIDAQRKNAKQEAKIAARLQQGEQAKANLNKDVNVGPSFANENKAQTEFIRQSQIQSNVRAGVPATQGTTPKFGSTPTPASKERMDTPTDTYIEPDQQYSKDREKELQAIIDKQEKQLDKFDITMKNTEKAIGDINIQFENFAKSWESNQQASGLFEGQFEEYMSQLKNGFAKDLSNQGFNLDLSDERLQEKIGELVADKNAGVIPNKEDFDRLAFKVLSSFAKEQKGSKQTGMTNGTELAQTGPSTSVSGTPTTMKGAAQTQISTVGQSWGTIDPDGGEAFDLGNGLNVTVGSNGQIQWENIDLDKFSNVSISKLNLLSNLNISDDVKRLKLQSLDNREVLANKIYEREAIENSDRYSNLLDKAKIEKEAAKADLQYQKDMFELDSSTQIDQMNSAKDKRMAALKGRLKAMGALDSGIGLMTLEEANVKLTDQIIGQKERNNLIAQKLTKEEINVGEAYVNTIERITIDTESSLNNINNKYDSTIYDINNDRLLTEQESIQAKDAARQTYINSVLSERASQAEALAKLDKEKRERMYEIQDNIMKQSGFAYGFNENGEIDVLRNEQGEPLLSMDGMARQIEIRKNESTIDKTLSETRGIVYENGIPKLDENGEFIPTLKANQFTIEQNYKYTKDNLDRKLEDKKMSLDTYKAEISKLNADTARIKAMYAETSWEGETFFTKRPGFEGTDGGASTAADFLDHAINYKDDPKYFGGQCGKFSNNYAEKFGIGRPFGDTLESKADAIPGMDFISPEDFAANPSEGFAIYDTGTSTGHVSIVKIDDAGKPYYIDSNLKGDERVNARYADNIEKKIIGYHVFPIPKRDKPSASAGVYAFPPSNNTVSEVTGSDSGSTTLSDEEIRAQLYGN